MYDCLGIWQSRQLKSRILYLFVPARDHQIWAGDCYNRALLSLFASTETSTDFLFSLPIRKKAIPNLTYGTIVDLLPNVTIYKKPDGSENVLEKN